MKPAQKTDEREPVVVHVERREDAPAAVAAAHADKDTTLHLRLTPEERRDLKTILGWMLYDPELLDSRERPGYASALRYSMRRCLANPPAHVKEAAGG